MAFDTKEKRMSAIHLTKRSGLPVPTGASTSAKRLHMIGIFSCIAPSVSVSFYWRNKNIAVTVWTPQVIPSDGSTQIL